jgi:hypothetical protein
MIGSAICLTRIPPAKGTFGNQAATHYVWPIERRLYSTAFALRSGYQVGQRAARRSAAEIS